MERRGRDGSVEGVRQISKEEVDMPYAHWGGPGLWVVFPLFWVLFWGAMIFFAVRTRRRGWNPWAASPAATSTGTAEAILAERFARGELTDDEYYQRLSVLKEGRS
jgi:putative membrane protein